MPDYTGAPAMSDIQGVIAEYERRGVAFLAAAIGQDQEEIRRIYGGERYLNLTNLRELPARLVRIIARHL